MNVDDRQADREVADDAFVGPADLSIHERNVRGCAAHVEVMMGGKPAAAANSREPTTPPAGRIKPSGSAPSWLHGTKYSPRWIA
jgi:hypothetical protein